MNKFRVSQFLVFNRTSIRTMATEDLKDFAHTGKKIIGAALNYMDVVRNRNVAVPKKALLFMKPSSSYIEEGKDIVIPRVFSKVAHEVELGVIIGKKCKNVSKADAMQYVGGYCLALDMTAQCELSEARKNGHPWTLGKGFDTATPVSRFIPLSEIKDPHCLRLWLKVNGKMRQDGNTSELIFKVQDLIEHASKHMTLERNDLILTGTPDGADPVQAGDEIECGLGEIVQMKFKISAEQV